MDDTERRLEIYKLMKKRRDREITPQMTEPTIQTPVPWYKRPLTKEEFSYKLAKNGRYYVRHKDWSEKVWIGPYRNTEDIKAVVQSYVTESLKGSLMRKYDESIHSVIIDNPKEFF